MSRCGSRAFRATIMGIDRPLLAMEAALCWFMTKEGRRIQNGGRRCAAAAVSGGAVTRSVEPALVVTSTVANQQMLLLNIIYA